MNRKYDLAVGVPLESQHGDKIVLYYTYFTWNGSDNYYRYKGAPINMLGLIWEGKWKNHMAKYRILKQTIGFDFEKEFKRGYHRWIS